jgi:hypothetical protein
MVLAKIMLVGWRGWMVTVELASDGAAVEECAE